MNASDGMKRVAASVGERIDVISVAALAGMPKEAILFVQMRAQQEEYVNVLCYVLGIERIEAVKKLVEAGDRYEREQEKAKTSRAFDPSNN